MTTHAADGIVMLPPGSPNVIGVQVSEVKRQRLARTLRVAGMMGEDESRHAVISAPVEGRIDGLSMNHEGQPVARRQPIATIFSRTLLNAADEYKNALPQGGATLLQARQKLERYGLVAEQINSIPDRQPDDVYFGVLSSLGGTIVKSYVSEGQYVKEGERLFELACGDEFSLRIFFEPVVRDDGAFFGKSLDVLGLFFQKTQWNEQGEVGVLMARLLKAFV